MGANVRISTVAIAQGNLTIRVTETPEVSQPAPLSRGGTTTTVPRTQIQVDDQHDKKLGILQGVTLRDLVASLNALGVGPRDMISILQSIKAAGIASRPGGALMDIAIQSAAPTVTPTTPPSGRPPSSSRRWRSASCWRRCSTPSIPRTGCSAAAMPRPPWQPMLVDALGKQVATHGGWVWPNRSTTRCCVPRKRARQRTGPHAERISMSNEPPTPAFRLAAILADENAALAALDFPRAVALLPARPGRRGRPDLSRPGGRIPPGLPRCCANLPRRTAACCNMR